MDARVLRYVRRHRVLSPGERVLVAVSGGQDSLALLLILTRLAKELEIELAVAHFDHRLRSREEARADEATVGGLAGTLGLAFAASSGDVRGWAKRRRESIEEAARQLRFDFLRRQARRIGAGAVVLGHTRDDRAETVLLHLLRGSGLDGIVGLRPRSSWPFGRGPALARPLLEVTRVYTMRYCREAGVTPREDPTNLLLDATRNRVRQELIPALRRFNPRVEEALCRLGEAAAGAADYLDEAAEAEWRSLASLEGEGVAFPRRAFGALAPALRARLLRRAVRHLAGATAELEAVHIAALEEALAKRRGSVSLPQGLTAAVGGREVRVSPARRGPPEGMVEKALADGYKAFKTGPPPSRSSKANAPRTIMTSSSATTAATRRSSSRSRTFSRSRGRFDHSMLAPGQSRRTGGAHWFHRRVVEADLMRTGRFFPSGKAGPFRFRTFWRHPQS
ncbi:MAG: tRNA lysidine(34) synthetase TilS [Chloroflexi bacterium]|nr:tRNA lysidine(34) synthetase TilS [Chloroflexota bacterium]